MKTPEEIKKGLECGNNDIGCPICPYLGDTKCIQKRNEDALALIQRLEAQNAELKRERDAAIYDLSQMRCCPACKHQEEKEALDDVFDMPSQCINCHLERSQFLWRGP